jgi:hypothetical protein
MVLPEVCEVLSHYPCEGETATMKPAKITAHTIYHKLTGVTLCKVSKQTNQQTNRNKQKLTSICEVSPWCSRIVGMW